MQTSTFGKQTRQFNRCRNAVESFNIGLHTHSFIFMPGFLLGRVAGAAALGGRRKPHDQQQSQAFLLHQHRDGTKQGEDVVTPPGVLGLHVVTPPPPGDRRCSHATWSLDYIWAAFPWM